MNTRDDALFSSRLVRSFRFRNDAASQVPAFGVLRIAGVETDDAGPFLTIERPNTYGSQFLHALNGPVVVDVDAFGSCVLPSQVDCVLGAYDTADGTPAFGEAWGPRDATWKLKKNTGGFRVVGNPDTTRGTVLVVQAPMLFFKGVTDASHSAGATGTVSIYFGTGNGSDTGVNMGSVWNAYRDLDSGMKVDCRWDDVGEWRLIAAECS